MISKEGICFISRKGWFGWLVSIKGGVGGGGGRGKTNAEAGH